MCSIGHIIKSNFTINYSIVFEILHFGNLVIIYHYLYIIHFNIIGNPKLYINRGYVFKHIYTGTFQG